MDHDRSEGEGVGSQEYTGLRMKVLEWAPKAKETLEGKLPADANVFLVPATLRPETMYGQNAVFVSPKINYGIFRVSETDYYVMTHRFVEPVTPFFQCMSTNVEQGCPQHGLPRPPHQGRRDGPPH